MSVEERKLHRQEQHTSQHMQHHQEMCRRDYCSIPLSVGCSYCRADLQAFFLWPIASKNCGDRLQENQIASISNPHSLILSLGLFVLSNKMLSRSCRCFPGMRRSAIPMSTSAPTTLFTESRSLPRRLSKPTRLAPLHTHAPVNLKTSLVSAKPWTGKKQMKGLSAEPAGFIYVAVDGDSCPVSLLKNGNVKTRE